MFDLDEIFSKASQRYFMYPDTIPNSTKVCIVCKASSIVDNYSQGLSSRNQKPIAFLKRPILNKPNKTKHGLT